MESLTAAEQREFQSRMEKKQMREFMTIYSKMVQGCFDDCVNDFTTKALISREETCINRCIDKHMKSAERIGQRFQEQNAVAMQQGSFGPR